MGKPSYDGGVRSRKHGFAVQYMSMVRPQVRDRIISVASFFQATFSEVSKLAAAKIPEQVWFTILSRRQRDWRKWAKKWVGSMWSAFA